MGTHEHDHSVTKGEDENDFLRLNVSILMPSKPCEPAKSNVVKVTGVSNESTFVNFFMWSRVMLNSPVEEAKMSISGTM